MLLLRTETPKKPTATWTTGRLTVSLVSAVLTHLAVSLVPFLFPAFPLIIQLILAALVLALVLTVGRWCRRVLGVTASAPAVVFFSVLLVWTVYFVAVRPGVPWCINLAFNVEVAMLIIGVYSMFLSDPGYTMSKALVSENNGVGDAGVQAHLEGSALPSRTRYCKSCKAFVKGYDHHCPAFGNCIGEKNHALFMVILIGFLCTEASFVLCSFPLSYFLRQLMQPFCRIPVCEPVLNGAKSKPNLMGALVTGTMLFSLLQVLWQSIFFLWHVYCICFNIRTDEWINWRKYPEFHANVPTQQGECFTDSRFRNPYYKGLFRNVTEILQQRTDAIGV